MRKSKFTPTHIAKILKEIELGKDLETLLREYGVSKVTFYKWHQHYGDIDASELKKVTEQEEKMDQIFS
ncbi:MAG: putative transposase [Luteibaculaceae bacterium]|jgi:putative transposase